MKKTLDKKIYKRKTKSYIYADKAYSNKTCINVAKENNLILVAENKENAKEKLFRKSRTPVNKYRYVIEASIGWMKNYAQIFQRKFRAYNL